MNNNNNTLLIEIQYITDRRTDRQTDGQTDGRTDGWTDGRMGARMLHSSLFIAQGIYLRVPYCQGAKFVVYPFCPQKLFDRWSRGTYLT